MKVGIVGGAISRDALLKVTGWDLWCLNNLYRQFQSVVFSRWFEIHEFSCAKGVFFRRGRSSFGDTNINRYLQELDALNIPVYMRKPYKRIKQSRLFPFRKMIQKYGSYFGCSLAWMIAMAIDEGADEIGIFGITLDGNEYYYQRPSVEYFLGLAKGMGIKIYIHPSSMMLKANYSYAYKEDYDLIYLLHGGVTKELTEIITSAVSKKINDLWANRSTTIFTR